MKVRMFLYLFAVWMFFGVSSLLFAQALNPDIILATDECEAVIQKHFLGPRGAQMATKQLDAILDSGLEAAEKVKKIRELTQALRPKVVNVADSDGDGLDDTHDPYPLIATSQPISWGVDSISLSWDASISQKTTTGGSETSTKRGSDKKQQKFNWGVQAASRAEGKIESGAEARGEVSADPLKGFGLFDAGASASIKASGSLSGSLGGQVEWSSNSQKEAEECYQSLRSESSSTTSQIDNLHLTFSIKFYNRSSETYAFDPKPIPIVINGEHIVDANAAKQGLVTIPKGRGDGIRVMYMAKLDTTKALRLVAYMKQHGAPSIRVENSQTQIKSTITGTDAISLIHEVKEKTIPISFAVHSKTRTFLMGKNDGERPLTLKAAMLAFNKWTKNNGGKELFSIKGDSVFVGDPNTRDAGAWVLKTSGKHTLIAGDILAGSIIIKEAVQFLYIDRESIYQDFIHVKITKKGVGNIPNIDPAICEMAHFKAWPEIQLIHALRGLIDFKKNMKITQKSVSTIKVLHSSAFDPASAILMGLALPEGQYLDLIAIELTQRLAEEGYPCAQLLLGFYYATGARGVIKNQELAYEWFKKSAEQGNAYGQWLLGVCYRDGRGAAKNQELAYEWFKKSAEQGDAIGQHCLGVCYRDGAGVGKNQERAYKWFKKSAEQGDAIGQYYLGVCYRDGAGVDKNTPYAFVWFEKSSNQGFKQAKEEMNSLLDQPRKP